MGTYSNISLNTIVQQWRYIANLHNAVNSFASGPLDFLDAYKVNKLYPYVFLRPMASTGVVDRVRTLTFNLYVTDRYDLSDESMTDTLSSTEEIAYELISYFNYGPNNIQQVYEVDINTMNPLTEAFQDRVTGWEINLDVITPWKWDYCSFPSGSA
jgi:hypothetical protein